MQLHQKQAVLAKSTVFCCVTQALPYKIFEVSPCKKRPDTGAPCEYLNVNKNNTACESCKYIGGARPERKFEFTYADRNLPEITESCFICHKDAVGMLEGKFLCFNCREMVRKRKARGKNNLFAPPQKR